MRRYSLFCLILLLCSCTTKRVQQKFQTHSFIIGQYEFQFPVQYVKKPITQSPSLYDSLISNGEISLEYGHGSIPILSCSEIPDNASCQLDTFQNHLRRITWGDVKEGENFFAVVEVEFIDLSKPAIDLSSFGRPDFPADIDSSRREGIFISVVRFSQLNKNSVEELLTIFRTGRPID